MIIEIKIEVDELTEMLATDKSNIQKFVNGVLEADMSGKHVIVISDSVSDWILDNRKPIKLLDDNERHLRFVIPKQNTFITSLLENTNVILIVKRNGNLTIKTKRTGKKECQIGYKELIDNNFLDKPELVVENVRYDGKLIKIIFDLLEEKFKNDSTKPPALVCKPVHGGGTDTTFIFRDLLIKDRGGENGIVVCICDKDMPVPYGKSKNFDKLQSIEQDYYSNNLHNIGGFVCTPGYSIENFLSLELILEIFNEVRTEKYYMCNAKKLKILKDSQKNVKKGGCLYLFFNVKNGIKEKDIKKFDTDEKKEWLKNKYNISDIEIIGYTFGGLGNVLKKFFLTENQIEKMRIEMDKDYWDKHFSDWLDPIMWYLCGRKEKLI